MFSVTTEDEKFNTVAKSLNTLFDPKVRDIPSPVIRHHLVMIIDDYFENRTSEFVKKLNQWKNDQKHRDFTEAMKILLVDPTNPMPITEKMKIMTYASNDREWLDKNGEKVIKLLEELMKVP